MPRRSPAPAAPVPLTLPFPPDDTHSSSTAASAPPPTAFLSYSRQRPAHNARVLALAKRLLSEGVDCNIDFFETSPPNGWPAWMLAQLQEPDFCIAVCTETYSRRFDGKEVPDQGCGATWEGRWIRQLLYESQRNDRVIPIVFEPTDVQHIPRILRDVTRYDLSTQDGYALLHRALTNQPAVRRPPLGPMRKRLPELGSQESLAAGLLRFCPDPLPLTVIARVLHDDTSTVPTTIAHLFQASVVAIASGLVKLLDPLADGIPPTPSTQVVGAALAALLDFIADRTQAHSARRRQVVNAVTLADYADIEEASVDVARTFRVVQSFLKSSGDKHLVLHVARRSIAASKVSGRTPIQTEDEAIALICGVSWVYQRTGRLPEALTEANISLALGEDIGSDRNTAFCNKCKGRLKRMESEALGHKGQECETLLRDSVVLLRDAIDRFTILKATPEVGDCYSLLGRTYLAAGQRVEARAALVEARNRLLDSNSKDYLDLQIAEGDLAARTNRQAAEGQYTSVLRNARNDDAQKSEVFARAYLCRGKVRASLGNEGIALEDFRRAAGIWQFLGDHYAADFAEWEIDKRSPHLDSGAVRVLETHSADVRVRVACLVRDTLQTRPVARSQRSPLPMDFLLGLVDEAKSLLATERPKW